MLRYLKIGQKGRDIVHITIKGNCCVQISERIKHRGEKQLLENGFNNTPNFYNIRSMSYGYCDDF